MNFNKKLMALCLVLGSYSYLTYGDIIETDQEYADYATMGCYINDGCRYIGQSFTAEKTGMLADVSIDVNFLLDDYDLNVMLFDAENGIPTSAMLASALLDGSYAALSFPIVFDDEVEIIAGHQYALIVNYPGAPDPTPGMARGIWMGAETGYAGGGMIYGNSLVHFGISDEYDLRFRTRVSVDVPEPGAIALMISSMLFLGLASAFHRKKK